MMTTTLLATALAFLQQAGGAAARAEAAEMTTGGWVFMAAAWVFILTLVYYTFSKVLRGGK
jgi:choline-glycine betaine transporter